MNAPQPQPHYPFRVIVVPTDFSTCSEAALTLALDMAAANGARLVLVHVIDVGASLALDAAMSSAALGFATAVGVDQQLRENAATALEAAKARVLSAGLPVETRACEGTPEEEIIAIASEVSADLIVMGTQGRSGLEHLLVGSVAEKVVRGAPMPVLTVRRAARN
jgi:nucleotide-binding universal stress UspA family protein